MRPLVCPVLYCWQGAQHRVMSTGFTASVPPDPSPHQTPLLAPQRVSWEGEANSFSLHPLQQLLLFSYNDLVEGGMERREGGEGGGRKKVAADAD